MLPEGFEFRSHSAQGHGVLRSDALSDVRELSHGFGPLVRLGLYCPGAILIVLSLFIIKCRFPGTSGSGAAGADVPQMRAKPKMMLEGLVAVVFGVCAFSTFYVVAVWMPRYAAAFGGMKHRPRPLPRPPSSGPSPASVFALARHLSEEEGAPGPGHAQRRHCRRSLAVPREPQPLALGHQGSSRWFAG